MSTAAPDSRIAQRLAPFGTTIFTEMTRLANEHGAVNLAQGFPDFDGPDFVKQAAHRAMLDGHNQYARMFGLPVLNTAIAASWKRDTGRDIDPDTEVTVTSGCTEAIAASLLGICNPGDEVVLFEPFYDSYRACVAMAGASPRFVTLRPDAAGEFVFDESELRSAFTPRTRAILLNTPHNPTGKVFTRAELSLIATLCVERDVIAITDEVYERLLFDPQHSPHIRLATLDAMADRTITLSSLGKTYSLTGWKIGWAIAPPHLTRAVRAAHQFLTFATATPLQIGAAAALTEGGPYVASLVDQLSAARRFLGTALAALGLRVFMPAGTYFIMVDHTPLGFDDDIAFCRHLTTRIGVAAIPPSVFYNNPAHGRPLARFAFCKKQATLEEAVRRLQKLAKG
ncbi:MAG: aminotransferase class I/II-fold pyridoxal phosphate-dependent enzyme [Phycisphaeraceae bacterium]|nr:aminotransferase class I/II-fold pyridoxal phosphate-dependent enzyme [Phycisphaeraceae bacterium]